MCCWLWVSNDFKIIKIFFSNASRGCKECLKTHFLMKICNTTILLFAPKIRWHGFTAPPGIIRENAYNGFEVFISKSFAQYDLHQSNVKVQFGWNFDSWDLRKNKNTPLNWSMYSPVKETINTMFECETILMIWNVF